LSLYSALKSASFSSGLAMMARFSFFFFQRKSLKWLPIVTFLKKGRVMLNAIA
jgi:hypothetical protein